MEDALARGASIQAACKAAGLSRQALYQAKSRNNPRAERLLSGGARLIPALAQEGDTTPGGGITPAQLDAWDRVGLTALGDLAQGIIEAPPRVRLEAARELVRLAERRRPSTVTATTTTTPGPLKVLPAVSAEEAHQRLAL